MPGRKQRWGTLFGHTPGTYVYGQYTTDIVGNILFHSVPYTIKGDPSSLEYWEYDKLGTKASAGCIRLTVQDAYWIYCNIPKGTTVEFYSDSNPGPLGKPSARKISGNVECRGWDPTDFSANNPWKNSNSQTNNKVEEKTPVEEQKEPIKDNNTVNNIVDNTNDIIQNNNTVTNNTIKNNTTINNTEEDKIVNNTIK